MSTKHLPGEHDQLTHAGGRGGSDGASDLSATDYRKVLYGEHAGTPDDPVPCGGDIERAAQVIADGGHVTLDQPDEVATLLDKLRDIVKDAEAKGEEAPIYDLCNVSVPGTNLFCQDSVTRPDGSKIDRVEMPQLSTKKPVPGSPADAMPRNKKGEVDLSGQFGEFLASSGRTVTDTTISASHLRASQDDLNGGKVAGIAGAMAAGIIDVNDPKNAIYVTRDNYVIDGHHRWAAAVAEQYTTGKEIDMPVRVVDMDIGTALTVANFWTEEMGIPPASASETKKSYDPWLFRVAIGTPELLDVVRKMAEDPAPAPKHLPGEHDQLDHAGGGQQGRLDLRGEIPLAEAVREQFETQSGGPLANTQGFEGGEVLGYDAGFQYADFGGDVYRRPPGGAFRWESSREHFDHFSARGAFPGFIPGKHLPGQHDQDTHGRGGGNPLPGAADPPRTGPTGEIQASDAGDAWSQLDADRFDRDQQEKAHPENYEPNRGFGVHLKLGATEWRRDVSPEGVPTIYQVLGTDPRTLPIEDRASAGLPMSAPDGTPIVALRVEGSEQPDPFVYRVMSVSEFDQAQERGYFESNQSMNLADEGTVTSRGSTGTFYAPPNGEDMRIVQLDMDPDDGWKVDRDGYVKTHQRVPFARARAYSTPLANPRAMKAFDPNQPRDPLGRWVVHGFQAGLPRSEENPFREYTVEAPSASDAAVEAQRLAQEEFGDRTSYGFVPSYVEEVPAVPGITADDPAELLSNLDNGYESPEEIAAALQQLGAVEVKFDAPGVESVYLYQPEDGSEPTVITWDGKTDYSETHNAYDWVGEQDPEDYFPEHDQEFSDQFWRNPDVLYHGTDPANIDSILENGLERRNETRGISNRYEGAAVYTSIDPDDAEYYYGQVLVIDTAAMAADGFKPFVNQEPEVVRSDLQGALANQIGLYDYDPEYEPDMNPNTVVVNADIPPQYITVMSLAKARAVYTAKHLPGQHDQLTHGRDAAERLSRLLPNATVSFSGLSPEDADELSAGIGEVAEDFPAAAALIRRVYPVDAGGTGVFSARYIPGEIQIASDQRGPHGPRWSGAHEMGHAVLESIGLVPPYRHAVGDAKGQRELLKAAGAEGETDDELRKWLGSTVTRYAGSGIWAEAIAESLAASYESDSPAARKFGLQVRKELKKRGARKPKHLPGQHDQLTHGRGGGGIPDTDDDRARINSAAAMQEAAAARGLYPGGEVHYIGRYDGRFYQGTITKIDEQGVHLDVPASSTYGSSRNEDSIKQPEEISPVGEMPVIPEGAPVYELANGQKIVGPWDPQHPEWPAEFATLIRPDGVATVLTAREARSAIREDAAVIRPVEVGDLVVATTGDVGTLVRLNGRGEGTAAIKLSNGQILADVSKGLQHAGTWETPAGWTAAGVTPDREKAREVYSVDDGSGRVYAITYPAGWKDNTNTIQGMREALVMAIEDNHAMEADTGTKSGWRGTLNFEENQRHNVAGTKEWDCSITIGSSVTRGMRSGAPESGRFWNPADEQDARGVLVHELAHAMSNLRAGPYQADPGWEEGVVEAYRQSFMAVQAYGADELSRRDAPGYRSYSPWVDALDSGMRLAGRGRTHGDRLAYYRELLPLVPIDRSRSVDQQIKDAGHSVHVALTGEPGGWGRGGEPSGHLVTAEKSAEMSEADVREVIYSARTLAQVKKALDVFYAYAESHPDTSMSLRMDAEWLVMFITAHEETTGKKHLPGQHDQLDHGRGGQSGESGVPRVTADQAEEIVRTYEPRSTEDEYGEPITTGLFLRWTADPEGDLSRGYSINHQTGESEMGLSVTETTAAQTWHGLDTGTTLAERITEYGFGGGEPYLVEAWWNGYARGSDGEPVVEPIRFVAKIREDGRKHLPGQHDQLDHGVRGPSTDAGAIVSGGTPEPEWRMDHQPDPEGAPSYDLTQIMPADVYEHPEWYAITNSGDPDYDRASRESIAALMRIRGHPNARVRVYRSSPQGTRIGPGDWVSLSPTYARLEGKHPSDPSQDMPVHSMLVRARDVLFAGDDLNEFGYFPNQTPEQVARHDEAERSRVEERRRRRELEGKHLPGQHDQLDHGRRGPSAPGPELSVMEHSPTSLQVFARDDSGAEVGRLTMMQNHGEWSVLHVETSDELRRTGLATRMLEKFHAVRPDVDVVIRNFETAEGHQWAVAMTERHPDWVRMDDLQTQADELEGTIADLRNNAIPATSDPAEAAQLRRDAENLAAELAVVRQRLAGGNVELPETSVELPRTAEEVEAAWVAGTETFYRAIERIAGRPADDQTPAERVYRQRNIDAAEPEAVTEEQRARCAADAAEWYADPQIQKEFSAYGRPPVVAASRLVGIGDAGEDPAEQQVAGQWVNGTIFLYGNVAGNPDAPATEGFTVGGNDNRTTLTHEYGHQVMSVVGFDQEGEVSDFLMEFVQTIEGNAETPAQERENLKKNAGQISGYAVQGGPAETFAEAFALLHQPDFDIEDYTGGAREALQLLRDRIDADVRASRGILEGQEALFE